MSKTINFEEINRSNFNILPSNLKEKYNYLIQEKDGTITTHIGSLNQAKDEIVYTSGYGVVVCGHITSSKRMLVFTIPVYEALKPNANINFNSLKIIGRTNQGKYLDVGDYTPGGIILDLTSSGHTITTEIPNPHLLRIQVAKNSDYTYADNNMPLSVEIADLSFTVA